MQSMGADMDGIGIEKLGKLLETEFEVVDLSPVLERGIPRWPSHPHLVIDKTANVKNPGDMMSSGFQRILLFLKN